MKRSPLFISRRGANQWAADQINAGNAHKAIVRPSTTRGNHYQVSTGFVVELIGKPHRMQSNG